MTSKRWIVLADSDGSIEAIVARAGGDTLAIAEGRVFIGRVRAKGGEVVAPGVEVTLHEAREALAGVRILYREEDFVAVDKPAGIPTIADHGGQAHALVALVAKTLDVPETTVHPSSRLDRGVSGVVLLALTPRGRERLAAARAQGKYARRYVALAAGVPTPEGGRWTQAIGRAKDPRKRAIDGRDATDAETRYRVVARTERAALLALDPITGRTHQLRVHASHAGAPLLGDRDYGGPTRWTLTSGKSVAFDRIALHCARVTLEGVEPISSEVPEALRGWWTAIDGEDGAWEAALETPAGLAPPSTGGAP